MQYPTIEDAIGKTPLVALQRIGADDNQKRGNILLGKLEGNNPAGSVKDRPALSMIKRAQERGEIKPGDTLIEATSGNTGIALAMAAAIMGYRMVLIMPEDLSVERAQTMKAFGAELVLTPKSGGMEYARDLAENMQRDGKGRVLDQFANADNPRIHYETTGPELWEQTGGRITHFVSAMGTTGTITGVSRFLKEKNPAIRIIGAQPSEGSRIPGIRKWPQEYLPKIYDPSAVDETINVSQEASEDMCRRMAREEGIFAGISSAGRLLGRPAGGAAGGERDHRVRRLRPRRPLSLDRRVPGVSIEPKFCPQCATPLAWIAQQEDSGDKQRLRCPACGWTHWNNPTPVLAAVIEYQGRILLARNAAWTNRMFALITGFMEAGETPQEGITREIAEETGLRVQSLDLIGAYDFQRMNQVIIAYHALCEGEVRLSPELVEYKLFDFDRVRCWPAGTGHALADWLRSRGHEPAYMEFPRRDGEA
jgi:cysteine synthase B